MNDIPTKTLILSYLVRFLGVFLILFSLMAAYLGYTSLVTINQNGTLGGTWGLSSDSKSIYVTNVEKDMPAYLAGIQSGDTVVKVGGKPVTAEVYQNSLVQDSRVGDTITVTVRKNGTE